MIINPYHFFALYMICVQNLLLQFLSECLTILSKQTADDIIFYEEHWKGQQL
jgi:hypothetical protein